MNTLKDMFRISFIALVISVFLIPLYIKLTRHNEHIVKQA